jgi:hypothetical protein
VIGAKSVELQIDGLYHGPRLAAAEEDWSGSCFINIKLKRVFNVLSPINVLARSWFQKAWPFLHIKSNADDFMLALRYLKFSTRLIWQKTVTSCKMITLQSLPCTMIKNSVTESFTHTVTPFKLISLLRKLLKQRLPYTFATSKNHFFTQSLLMLFISHVMSKSQAL